MAFALTVNQLIPALKQPGCPICNLQRATVQRFLASFLQENMMDRAARQKVLDSLGFCPTHTFQLAAMEMRNDGDPLGTNILHEQINGRVQQALRKWQSRRRPGWLRNLQGLFLKQIGRAKPAAIPVAECPVCVGMRENNSRALAALLDELGRSSEEIVPLYEQGDGLCLGHLRQGLDSVGDAFPAGAEIVVQDAHKRLESQQLRMREYIHKHNLSYQDETMKPEEECAWREALGFYSGYPPSSFGPFERKPD
jgi:hypothetical protein